MKKGLILGGGGARGAYQVGVWRAFREAGVTFAGAAGTSVGAINAAIVVQDDLDAAVETWMHMKPEYVLPAGNSAPLRALLARHIDEERIRVSPMEYALCTVGVPAYKPQILFKEDIPKGQLIDYMLASAAIPGVFPCVIDGRRYADGGLFDNLPVRAFAGRGYDSLTAVNIAWRGPFHRGAAGLHVQMISHDRSLGGILQFEEENCRRNLERGWREGRRALGVTAGRAYYLLPGEPPPNEDALEALLSALDARPPVARLGQKLLTTARVYAFGKGVTTSRHWLYRACLELAAELLGVDREREYVLGELEAVVRQSFSENSALFAPLFSSLARALSHKPPDAGAPTLSALLLALSRNPRIAARAARLGLSRLYLAAVFLYFSTQKEDIPDE